MENFKIDSHEVIFKATCKITSPLAFSSELYYCVSENGDIYKLTSKDNTNEKNAQIVFTILGCPTAIDVYHINQGFIISDLAHQSIFLKQDQNEDINNLISEYNERAFYGPSSVVLNESSSFMFFTDSGAFGETSLENTQGSLFCYRFEDKSLRALVYRELAFPCGVIISSDEKFLLVCELGENRIIKVVLDENMSGNYSVFHQFSGRVGPSSIHYFNGFYFVSLFEFSELDNVGVVAVLNEEGDLIEKINLPTGPEISSIRFVPHGIENSSQMTCLVTERNRLHEIKFRGERNDLQSEDDHLDLTTSHKK